MSEFLRYDRAGVFGTATSVATFLPMGNNKEGIQAIDVRHFNTVAVQLTGTWVGTVTFEISNDGSNWVGVYGVNAATGAITLTATSNAILVFPVTTKYFRARVSAYTSGTISGNANLSSVTPQIVQNGMAVTVASTSLTGSTSSGHSTFSHIMSTASTNATSVKASLGAVGSIVVGNNGAAVAYLKLYNKASAPVVGTDTPVSTILIPVGQTVTIEAATAIRFSTGIAYAITGGAAVTDTTAVAANQVVGHINYT